MTKGKITNIELHHVFSMLRTILGQNQEHMIEIQIGEFSKTPSLGRKLFVLIQEGVYPLCKPIVYNRLLIGEGKHSISPIPRGFGLRI